MIMYCRVLSTSWSTNSHGKITQTCLKWFSQSLSTAEHCSSTWYEGERSLLEYSPTAEGDSHNFSVIPNFVTPSVEENLLNDINRTLRGKRYQFDHWDGAIQGYRETEKSQWLEINQSIMERLQKVTSSAIVGKSLVPLPAIHVLDLAEDGHIEPHIDSIKFCGDVIAGISLLSQSVMKLQHEDENDKWICALLPRLSLYIMRGVTRYNYTHAILNGNEQSVFKGRHIVKNRRVSIICRTLP